MFKYRGYFGGYFIIGNFDADLVVTFCCFFIMAVWII